MPAPAFSICTRSPEIVPLIDGIGAPRQISALLPDARIRVVTPLRMTTRFSWRCRPAHGHALRDADADALVRAARAVTAGSTIFLPAVTRRKLAPLNGPRPLAPEVVPTRFERKRVILYPIRQRLLNPPIAGDLPVRRKSLANDVSSIFSKLQVADHAEAIVRARDAGLDRGQRAP